MTVNDRQEPVKALNRRCGWSVWNRFTPARPCGRLTVDGEHCAQHAKMAAKTEAANAEALADLRASFDESAR